MRYRSGIGYDVHAFAEGRPLVLGGVTIPHDRGLAGHSDADVLSHAIADAILGALGEPDIGFWFFPSDASIEGISSLKIIEKANQAIKQLAENEKYDLIVQDVVWVSPKLDITDKVIKALSDSSGR